jgi:hypothetical protein
MIPSVSSSVNFGVEPLQFDAGVLEAELPINAALLRMCFVGPPCDFALPFGQWADATGPQTLARYATQFAFGDMQPPAMLRGVAKMEAFAIRARPGRFEGFIQRAFRVRVEVVAQQWHVLTIGIACIQHLRDFARPVCCGPSDAGSRLPEARGGGGAHENAGGAIALVCVVDTSAMLRRRGDGHPRPPCATGPAVRPCPIQEVVEQRLAHRFRALLPCRPRMRRLALAESPRTQSSASSYRFF